MIRVFVDADACPVREETVDVATRFGAQVFLVANGGLRPHAHPDVRIIFVDDGADAADKWIADEIGPGDLCVTADMPLAARVVENGAVALKPNGELLDARNVGQALAQRDLMADLRAANPLAAAGGPRPFSKQDRSRFKERLDATMRAIQRGSTPRR
ncbi:MAG: YaiI/YqxD family protein [Pseudomonadota bacterium]